MRVGIVCPYSLDVPGGVQAHVLDLARVLRRRGHESFVLGPATDEAELPEWVRRGGPAFPVPYNGSVARLSFGPKVRRVTREFIAEGDFDVLHIHEPNALSYSMAALRMAHGPIVATYHASAASSRALKIALPGLRLGLEKIRGGIAVSEMARRWQVEQVGADPVLIPNGVDTRRFAKRREIHGAGEGAGRARPCEVVFLGRLDEPRKGLDIFLSALELVDRDVRATVIGAGRARRVDGVEFLGAVSEEEKAAILGRADIYAAPNTGGESFGIVLVEAMAAGCAVVASDLEAFADVCRAASESPAGLVFPVGDAHALALSVRRLIDAPSLRRQLAQAGVERSRDFDWETVATQIIAVYETVSHGEKVVARSW